MKRDLIEFYRRLLEADNGKDLIDADPLFPYVAVLGASDLFSSAEPLIRDVLTADTEMERLTVGFQKFLVTLVLDGLRKR